MTTDPAYEKRLARLLLDVLIRAGLVLARACLASRVRRRRPDRRRE